jgi:hypothetical protein
MKMKALSPLVLLLAAAACSAQPTTAGSISPEKLGEVLHCLDAKLSKIGMAPPKAKADSYLVQYYYGVLTPKEEDPNELQLIVYAPDGSTANLYRVYFDQTEKNSIYLGDGATVKKENGKMVPDEISGGLGSLEEMNKVLNVTNKQKPIVIPQSLVVQGNEACIYDN